MLCFLHYSLQIVFKCHSLFIKTHFTMLTLAFLCFKQQRNFFFSPCVTSFLESKTLGKISTFKQKATV